MTSAVACVPARAPRARPSATPAPMVGLSLGMYLSLYAMLIVSYVGVLFYLARKAGQPVPAAAEEGETA